MTQDAMILPEDPNAIRPEATQKGSVGQTVGRFSAGVYGQDDGEAIGKALLTFAPILDKRQEKAQREEGQRKITDAAMQGRQMEALAEMEKEEPWYVKIFGPSVRMEGAVKTAAAAQAAQLAGETTAELLRDPAAGGTASMAPRDYREHIGRKIAAMRTGNSDTDAVLHEALSPVAERLSAAHLTKNVEWSQKSAITSSMQAATTLAEAQRQAAAVEVRPGLRNTPEDFDKLGAAWALTEMIDQHINYDTSPSKAAGATPEAHYRAVYNSVVGELEAGDFTLYDRLVGTGKIADIPADLKDNLSKQYDKANTIRVETVRGKFIPQMLEWVGAVDAGQIDHGPAFADAMWKQRAEIMALGVDPPDIIKDADAIMALTRLALNNNRQALAAVERSGKAQGAARVAAAMEGNRLDIIEKHAQMRDVHKDIYVTAADGSVANEPPTDKELQQAYKGFMNKVAALPAPAQAEALAKFTEGAGPANRFTVAKMFDTVDTQAQGRFSNLTLTLGKPVDAGTLPVLQDIVALHKSDPANFDKYFENAQIKNLAREFIEEVSYNGGDPVLAHSRTFGVPREIAKNSAAFLAQLSTEQKNSIKSRATAAAADYGDMSHVAAPYIEGRTKAYLALGHSSEQATKYAKQDFEAGTQVIDGEYVPRIGKPLREQMPSNLRQDSFDWLIQQEKSEFKRKFEQDQRLKVDRVIVAVIADEHYLQPVINGVPSTLGAIKITPKLLQQSWESRGDQLDPKQAAPAVGPKLTPANKQISEGFGKVFGK